MDWQEWLKANEHKHEFIKHNLLNATLTFHQRVKMFIKHIIMSTGNPMAIKYNSYKVEFALRGAGHIHGVLWVDWENFTGLPKENVEAIQEAFKKIKADEPLNNIEKKSLAEFADKFISCSLKDPKTEEIVKLVNMHHHTKTCRKYGCTCRFHYPRFPTLKTIISVPVRLEAVSVEAQEQKLVDSKKLLDKVKKVLENKEEMEELSKINAEEIEQYKQTLKATQKVEMIIAENPGKKTSIIKVTDKYLISQVLSCDNNVNEYQIKKVDLINKFNELNTKLSEINLDAILKDRLVSLLGKAEIEGEDKIKAYEKALKISSNGYRVIHKRDIDEIFVNNYNPEWIHSWNANMDLQLCLDYFAVITYISDYCSKDDSGTMKHIKAAMKEAGNETQKSKLALVVNTFLTHRQI